MSTHASHTLYDPDHLLELAGGSAPASMGAFQKLVDKAGDPAEPAADPPKQLPPLPSGAEAGHIPSLKDLGYSDKPTTHFPVGSALPSPGRNRLQYTRLERRVMAELGRGGSKARGTQPGM